MAKWILGMSGKRAQPYAVHWAQSRPSLEGYHLVGAQVRMRQSGKPQDRGQLALQLRAGCARRAEAQRHFLLPDSFIICADPACYLPKKWCGHFMGAL